MADATTRKAKALIQSLDRRFGKVNRPEFMPPPSSADMDAALAVATRNSEIVASAVLGLHGPPDEGREAARKLMNCYVDWNEIRVANRESLARAMGKDPRAMERATNLQRFLEAFFLRQRNMNLECLVEMKPSERKQFLGDLEVFARDELAAMLLSCFGHGVYPPAEPLNRVGLRCGMLKPKTTALQMCKILEKGLSESELLSLCSHLYRIARSYCHQETPSCGSCPLRLKCPTAKQLSKSRR
jgi:endonuclease III